MLPCETTVKDVIPSIKADIAKTLKSQGKKQREIAETLGVTESAVSMYLSGQRGSTNVKKSTTKARKHHKKICTICTQHQDFCKGV